MPFYRRSRSFGPLPTVGPAPQSANASVLHSAATPASQPADPCEVGYAVVDLETTGLSPATDAILEIGLVLTAPDGTPQRTWSTLINPGAGPDGAIEVGPTFIHGLLPDDLAGAPSLDDVADLLVRDLAGRVVVAHNARFDVGFLTQALGTRGHLARGARVPRVCTMEWARHFITTPSRRLTTCCEVAGVEIGRHHSALDDAEAAAGLLRHYMAVGRQRGEETLVWSHTLADAAAFRGWSWDDAAARAQEQRLTRRPGPGVPRAH
ncbi:3'-5' exonuclease [Actinomyces urogenitalis]|uniref:3'-5' exonuclease n=1 Tax=Actinomyces urogenitalis TaxID=103621 RepID=UPI0029002A4F|nr:3'-5' exonuclease [Actinomyces urogenitalis]MDU0863560.1 3'-5' exonuclease [Actinomyces urogenitalis]MDU0874095.1 3'-5' exonuclease [Actinomyces urogenitalis]MDU1563797.1 3'-5' exonuclease [Actinomyces urogenitalis]MDU1639164.1 3'-5' exonuclease [Actinomyces urogenitalis]MDU6776914.1 3'-5' exonuclease [Actinomyces urogenitalis]